jgi:CheY-like chemotaxis protein
MPHPLHVLILEDQPDDAELVLRELRRAEFDPNWLRVETEPDYLARLDPRLDVILADYTLPQFNALQALRLLRDRGLDVPFIVVTGTIGEEAAAECIKQGATDYLLKDRLGRLGQAVARGLEDRRLRIRKRQADEALALRTRQFEAVRAVTEEITRELDLSVVLNLIAQRAVGLLGVGSGAVFLWDTATQRLIPKAWHGLGDSLCANMNETLPPKEFRVEGEEGVGDEFLEWSGSRGDCARGRGDGQGHPATVFGGVQAEGSAGSGGMHPARGDRRPAPAGGVVLLALDDLAGAAGAGRAPGPDPEAAGTGA